MTVSRWSISSPALPDGVGRRCPRPRWSRSSPLFALCAIWLTLWPMRRSWYSISLERLDGGRIAFLLLTCSLPSNSFTASMMVRETVWFLFLAAVRDHPGFLLVHHEMHLDGALLAPPLLPSFALFRFLPQ